MSSMKENEYVGKLEKKAVKPTANRILVLKALDNTTNPVGLSELEQIIDTMDKSSIFRVLTLFLEHDLVHAFEDGRGVLKYELCSSEGHCNNQDAHIHFYCEACRQTYCFPTLHIPTMNLPEGFSPHSINYMIKGECPTCKSHHHLKS